MGSVGSPFFLVYSGVNEVFLEDGKPWRGSGVEIGDER